LFPDPLQTDALASLIDVLPTLASIAGVQADAMNGLRGVDLTPVFSDPNHRPQGALHFTYDDDFLPEPRVPGFIRAFRTEDLKYAVYFDPINAEFEYELYDLRADPLERRNLAFPAHADQHLTILKKCHQQLREIMQRNQTLPESVEWPAQPDPSSMLGAMLEKEVN